MASLSNQNPRSNLAKLVLAEIAEEAEKKAGFIKSTWTKSTRPLPGSSPRLFKAPQKESVEQQSIDEISLGIAVK